MTCIAIALGVLGIAAMRRAHHRYHGHAGWYGPFGHGCHGPAGMYGRRHGRKRMMLHALFMRIDATPAQERAIVHEFEKLEDRVRQAKAGLFGARGDFAAALRGPVLDDAALGAVLGHVDAATGEVRGAVIDALRGVHGVLDDRQRGQVADFFDHGGGGWWRGFGPYR